VFWKKGELAVALKEGEKPKGGHLQTVHGVIFKADKPANTYQSDRGQVDRQANLLKLMDHVRVDSVDPKFTLTCDSLTYEGKRKIMKAKGHVQILGAISSVGTIEELWTNADFSKIASPDQFDQP
jgi:lipopolysaccharide export system protein LptA